MPTMRATNRPQRDGFTLVEMLIVAPIAILVVVTIVVFMMILTGDALLSRERAAVVFRTQDALDRIEQDVRIGKTFLSTSGTLTSPQGSDTVSGNTYSGTAAFANTSAYIVIQQYATTANPYNSNRSLVYYSNSPNTCGSTSEIYNSPVQTMIIYFIDGTTLYRRTIVPTSPSMCETPWQRNSCKAGINTATVCRATDETIATGVSALSMTYYSSAGSTTPMTLSSTSYPRTLVTSITSTSSIAGKSVTYTGSLRASLLNN